MSENKTQLAPLRRGIVILKALAEHDGWMSFTKLTEACGDLAAPTLSRLLKVMVEEQLVEKHPENGNYRPGKAFLILAKTALYGMPWAETIQPVVDSLAQQTKQSAAFFRFDHDAIIMIAKFEIPDSCHYIPLHARNTGIIHHGFAQPILAYLPREQLQQIIAIRSTQLTEPLSTYYKLLSKVRDEGFCIEEERSRQNWVRFTAPVFGGMAREPIASIGISVIIRSFKQEGIEIFRRAVQDAARRASQLLGGKFDHQISAIREAMEENMRFI